ncbi:MAG: hypothetical protein AB7F65_10630 [Dehalococcoidia bacterium]
MNTPTTSPARTATLAVVGWSPEAADAVAALQAAGAYRAVGIADASGAALVRARRDTGLACHQQVRQFLAAAEYDAVLVGVPGPEAPRMAAARGADLLVLPCAVDIETIEAAVDATRTHGVRLAVVRPEAHDAGISDLVRLVTTDPEWAPRYLDLTVEGPAETERLLGAAIAHALRLAPEKHGLVRASTWTGDTASLLRAVDASVLGDRVQIHLRVRHAPRSYVRIVGDAVGGAFELRIAEHEATLAYTSRAGERTQYPPEWRDHWAVEAHRVAFADDALHARETAALLSAIVRAAATGEPQATDCCTRPELRILEGRGQSQHSRANLRLVVS